MAQTKVLRNTYVDGNKVETVMFPSETMFFKSQYSKKDTAFIGIMVDSITPKIVSPKLYSFLPKGEIDMHSGIFMTFFDGSTEWFPIIYKDKSTNYVEYGFSTTAYKSLCRKRISSILVGVSNYYKKEYETYFIDFLKLI